MMTSKQHSKILYTVILHAIDCNDNLTNTLKTTFQLTIMLNVDYTLTIRWYWSTDFNPGELYFPLFYN